MIRRRAFLALAPLALAGCLIGGDAELAGYPRVIDGDTLSIRKTTIRLWGIDAPEIDTTAGRAARDALARLIEGRPIYCRKQGEDSYGRTVAQCFLGTEDIAAALVDAGYARDWPRFSRGYYAKPHG